MKVCLGLILIVFSFFQSHGQSITTDSVLIEGNYRTFHFSKPQEKIKNRNLLFVLHGSGGNGEGMIKPAEKLQAKAEKEALLLVYPDGYKKYWNECRKGATSEANVEDVNEQAFFNAMINYFEKSYKVNNKGFFVIGLSGGGHMAYKLAITMPQKCRAISAVVANLPDTTNMDCQEAKQPVAVMITNGTLDPLNPHKGGKMIMNGASWGEVRSTDRSFKYWAELAGYKGTPLTEELPDADTTNRQTLTRYTYKEEGKPEVALLQVNNGAHAFPTDIDIFLESWAFFQREIQRKDKSSVKNR